MDFRSYIFYIILCLAYYKDSSTHAASVVNRNSLFDPADSRCVCGPGEYVKTPCNLGENKPAVCQKCDDGYFNSGRNAAHSCAKCHFECLEYKQVKTQECTKFQNIICECEPGYYYSKAHSRCLRHKKCAPGEGVSIPGTPFTDTKCEKCALGKNYSNSYSATESCNNCTVCLKTGVHNFTARTCNVTHDTVCIAPVNPDKPLPHSTVTPTHQDSGSSDDNIAVWIGLAVGILVIAVICVTFICKRNRKVLKRRLCWGKERSVHFHYGQTSNAVESQDEESLMNGPKMERKDFNSCINFLCDNLTGSDFHRFYLELPGNEKWTGGQNESIFKQSEEISTVPGKYYRHAMGKWETINQQYATKKVIWEALKTLGNKYLLKCFEEAVTLPAEQGSESGQNI